MADNLGDRVPADRSRVNINETWEIWYWCKEFDCTEGQLRTAVAEVGVSADAVRKKITGRSAH